MGIEIIALIAGLLGLIPAIISFVNTRKANRNDIGNVEIRELGAGMDAVDAATRVQSLPKQD